MMNLGKYLLNGMDEHFPKEVVESVEDVFNILMHNSDIRYYITLSIDPVFFEPSDLNGIMEYAEAWFRERERDRDLKFIIFPHVVNSSNGDMRIHIHGFTSDGIDIHDTGFFLTFRFSHPVTMDVIQKYGLSSNEMLGGIFNVSDWTIGFSMCYPIFRNPIYYFTEPYFEELFTVFGDNYDFDRNLDCITRQFIFSKSISFSEEFDFEDAANILNAMQPEEGAAFLKEYIEILTGTDKK